VRIDSGRFGNNKKPERKTQIEYTPNQQEMAFGYLGTKAWRFVLCIKMPSPILLNKYQSSNKPESEAFKVTLIQPSLCPFIKLAYHRKKQVLRSLFIRT
jgi:hypothetical protein